jgi:hypothetical protein
MAHVLFYDYVENMLELRAPHRPAHLERINQWRDQGKIVLAGAIGTPPRGAVIVFDLRDPSEVEIFASEDPYVLADLVTQMRIEPIALV